MCLLAYQYEHKLHNSHDFAAYINGQLCSQSVLTRAFLVLHANEKTTGIASRAAIGVSSVHLEKVAAHVAERGSRNLFQRE